VLLLDLLGRRWTLRVLWELREPAPSFRALRSRCDGVSSSVLWQRVNDLKDAGLVAAPEGQGLELTPLGSDLLESFAPLLAFAERWAARDRPRG
jgi:DNA-binding HxlR family transcriptional regulator